MNTTTPQSPKLRRDVAAVKRIMRGRGWCRIDEIQRLLKLAGIHIETQTVSARIRDLRKAQFGGHNVRRRYAGNDVWEYRLTTRRTATA